MTSGASSHEETTHVSWCTARVLTVLRLHVTSYPEIRQSQISFVVEHQVLGLEVSMDDLPIVNILERQHDASNEEFWWSKDATRGALVEYPLSPDVVPEVSSRQ